jgi:hypothetical protein
MADEQGALTNTDERDALSDLGAVVLGGVGGLVVGAGFGAALSVLLGGLSAEIWWVVVPHSALAMMFMGGWTAPSLLARDGEDL